MVAASESSLLPGKTGDKCEEGGTCECWGQQAPEITLEPSRWRDGSGGGPLERSGQSNLSLAKDKRERKGAYGETGAWVWAEAALAERGASVFW